MSYHVIGIPKVGNGFGHSGTGGNGGGLTDEQAQKLEGLPGTGRFGLTGFLRNDGSISSQNGYVHTPLIAVNHACGIITHGWGTRNTAALLLLNAAFNVIKFIAHADVSSPSAIEKTVEIPSAEIPEEAVYFATCTLASKIDESGYSNGETIEAREGAVSDAIQASKLALFVDLWTRCYDCTYDATKEKPFRCNEVDLTYANAIDVYNAPILSYNNVCGFSELNRNVKTIILESSASAGSFIDFTNNFRSASLVTIRLSAETREVYARSLAYAFYCAYGLEKVLGNINLMYASPDGLNNAFLGCRSLVEISLKALSRSLSFQDSPLLSLASLRFLVANAANTSAITVTVHADVYAKLTGDTTNEAAVALSEEELAAWGEVLTDAAARNISFACA